MPWYILVAIVVAQALLILYMRDNHSASVQFLNDKISTLEASNERLTATITTCEVTRKNSNEISNIILQEAVAREKEQRRIESELCALGWGNSYKTPTRRNSDKPQEETNVPDTIKPDDEFDVAISRLLKDAYDCASTRVCLHPNP